MQWYIIKPASRLRHVALFYYIVLHSRCTHYGPRCITSYRVWICMALASALAFTLTHYVKQQKDRNANNHLHPARLRIHTALHYTRVAFASRFPLRRHYVGIPLRAEYRASRWITSALHCTLAAVRIHVTLTLIHVLINRRFNASAGLQSGINFLREHHWKPLISRAHRASHMLDFSLANCREIWYSIGIE